MAPRSNKTAPPPNTRGWRAPWRRTWGPLSDGRSRLSKLAKDIEAELVEELKPTTAYQRRQVGRAARLEALAEATGLSIGTDPKATPRRLTGLEKAAMMKLAPLRAVAGKNGHGTNDPLADVRRAVAEANRA